MTTKTRPKDDNDKDGNYDDNDNNVNSNNDDYTCGGSCSVE